MKDHEINQAVAESVGFNWWAVEKGGWYYREGGSGYTNRIEEAGRYTEADARKELVRGEPMGVRPIPHPDYCNDLNAMHEVEKTLKARMDQDTYVSHLVSNLYFYCDTLPTTRDEAWVCRHCTARQCAEAYLRTIGKWRES